MFHHTRCLPAAALVGVIALAIASCGGGHSSRPTTSPVSTKGAIGTGTALRAQAMSLTSRAFADNGHIPAQYTCEGASVNPPLTIANVPSATVTLALTMIDIDAGGFVHWTAWNIAPTTGNIAQGEAPPSVQGQTFPNRPGYFGPCPPTGTHRYVFTLYALDVTLPLDASATNVQLQAAIQGHVLESAQLTGTYGS